MMILRGVGITLFPYYDLGGGLWKISNENYIKHRRGGEGKHFFPEKEKEMKICCWTLL